MRTRLKLMAFFLLMGSLIGCGDQRSPMVPGNEQKAKARQDARAMKNGEKEPPIERRIIFNGTIQIRVENLEESESKMRAQLKQVKGYVVESSISGSKGEQRTGFWKVRVPVSEFNPFREAILKLGEVEDNSTTSEDVTDKFIDLDARLNAAKQAEEQLLARREKAEKTEDWRALHQDLKLARTEVETLQGQLNKLKDLSAMSTLTLTFHERANYDPPGTASLGTRISRTFSDSTEAMKQVGEGILIGLVGLAPWLPLIGIGGFLVWRKVQSLPPREKK